MATDQNIRRSDALRVAILSRALKWYADPRHWSTDSWNVPSVVNSPDYGNPGAKARRALKRTGPCRLLGEGSLAKMTDQLPGERDPIKLPLKNGEVILVDFVKGAVSVIPAWLNPWRRYG